jgi:hypothetical protein
MENYHIFLDRSAKIDIEKLTLFFQGWRWSPGAIEALS